MTNTLIDKLNRLKMKECFNAHYKQGVSDCIEIIHQYDLMGSSGVYASAGKTAGSATRKDAAAEPPTNETNSPVSKQDTTECIQTSELTEEGGKDLKPLSSTNFPEGVYDVGQSSDLKSETMGSLISDKDDNLASSAKDKSRKAFELAKKEYSESRAWFNNRPPTKGDLYIADHFWQASRAHTLALLNSDRAVEFVASTMFNNMHEEKWHNEHEGIITKMFRDAAKAAIAALVKEIRG